MSRTWCVKASRAARVCPPATCTRISTHIGRGGGGRIEDGPGREGEGGRTGRHEGGGWSDASRERSVGLRPQFSSPPAARGGPGRSAGQNRKRGGPGSGGARPETLRDPFEAPSGGSDQEMMPRQHGASRTPRHLVAEGGRMVQPDGGGWSDRVVGRERAIWVVGWSDGT